MSWAPSKKGYQQQWTNYALAMLIDAAQKRKNQGLPVDEFLERNILNIKDSVADITQKTATAAEKVIKTNDLSALAVSVASAGYYAKLALPSAKVADIIKYDYLEKAYPKAEVVAPKKAPPPPPKPKPPEPEIITSQLTSYPKDLQLVRQFYLGKKLVVGYELSVIPKTKRVSFSMSSGGYGKDFSLKDASFGKLVDQVKINIEQPLQEPVLKALDDDWDTIWEYRQNILVEEPIPEPAVAPPVPEPAPLEPEPRLPEKPAYIPPQPIGSFFLDRPAKSAEKGEQALHLIHGKDLLHKDIWTPIFTWREKIKPTKAQAIPVQPFANAILVGEYAHKFAKDYGVDQEHRDAILDEVRCIKTQLSQGKMGAGDDGEMGTKLAGYQSWIMPSTEAAESLVMGEKCSLDNLAAVVHAAGYSLSPKGKMYGVCEMKLQDKGSTSKAENKEGYNTYSMAFCNGLVPEPLYRDRAWVWADQIEFWFGESQVGHGTNVKFLDMGDHVEATITYVDDFSSNRVKTIISKLESLGWSKAAKGPKGEWVLKKNMVDAQSEAKALGTLLTASKDLDVMMPPGASEVSNKKCGIGTLDLSYARAEEYAKDWKKPLPEGASTKLLNAAIGCCEKKCPIIGPVYSHDIKQLYKKCGCKF